jgi:hypothetical protein
MSAERPFIRVKDKTTKHEYDVHEQAFDPEAHEVLKRFEPVARPRRPKHHVNLRSAKGPAKTSVDETDQGASPDPASAS